MSGDGTPVGGRRTTAGIRVARASSVWALEKKTTSERIGINSAARPMTFKTGVIDLADARLRAMMAEAARNKATQAGIRNRGGGNLAARRRVPGRSLLAGRRLDRGRRRMGGWERPPGPCQEPVRRIARCQTARS